MAKRKCKNKECGAYFTPDTPEIYIRQEWCSDECKEAIAIQHYRKNQERNRKARERAVKKNLAAKKKYQFERKRNFREGDLKHQIELTQKAFNEMIRLIDKDKPCISCGKSRCGHAWDCGHFKTVAAHPELRFDPRNAYKQGSACNRGQARFRANERTVIQNYAINLLERMGREVVDWLNGPHPAAHFTCGELIEMRKKFKAESKYIRDHGEPSRDWRSLEENRAVA